MLQDYYGILGVSPHADADEIRKAYREKAKKTHPDITGNDADRAEFQLLNEAYHVLINEDRRRGYDFLLKYRNISQEIKREEYYRKYGATSRNYYYDGSYTRQPSEINRNKGNRNRSRYVKSIVDTYVFYFFLILGVAAIIFGTIDLIKYKLKEHNPIGGILFGVFFTFLLIKGWKILNRKK